MDIKFVQTQQIEIQLSSLQAKIDDKILKDAYQTGFNVVTQNDARESNKSYHCVPQSHKMKEV